MPTLYRIFKGEYPTQWDFRANLARCKPRTGSELRDVSTWAGLSMYDNQPAAESTARRNLLLGTRLAKLDVAADDKRVVLSPRGSTGQHTVWACEDLLLGLTREVIEITSNP